MVPTIAIPDDVDRMLVRELDRAAREAVGGQLCREGKLSHAQFDQSLGIGRGEADEVLRRHRIIDAFTADEIAAQVRVSQERGFA